MFEFAFDQALIEATESGPDDDPSPELPPTRQTEGTGTTERTIPPPTYHEFGAVAAALGRLPRALSFVDLLNCKGVSKNC